MSIPLKFFLNKQLHKREKIIKSQNWIVAWNFPEERRVQYNLSHVMKSYQKAYRTFELSSLLRYSKKKLKLLMERKFVEIPDSRSYTIGTYRPGPLYWSEDDVLKLRERLYELEPKKNGYPRANFGLISEAELLSVFRNSPTYYVQDEDGKMVRVWKAFI